MIKTGMIYMMLSASVLCAYIDLDDQDNIRSASPVLNDHDPLEDALQEMNRKVLVEFKPKYDRYIFQFQNIVWKYVGETNRESYVLDDFMPFIDSFDNNMKKDYKLISVRFHLNDPLYAQYIDRFDHYISFRQKLIRIVTDEILQ